MITAVRPEPAAQQEVPAAVSVLDAAESVGIFLDEVYLGRTAGLAADLFDLERAEVLRGPQGTLYGRNVVGGAVNLITCKPDDRVIQRLEGSYGNLSSRRRPWRGCWRLHHPLSLRHIERLLGWLNGMPARLHPALRRAGTGRRAARRIAAFLRINSLPPRFQW